MGNTNEEIAIEKLAKEYSQEEFRIKGLEEALETTKEKEEKVRQYVDKYYEEIYKLVEDTEVDFDILDAFSTISKTGVYLTQSYFRNKDEFDAEYKKARELVTQNILQSLGVNFENEELNKNSIVTYNGEQDIENFSLRRILLMSYQLAEYALWQLTLTKTFEEKANELN